MKEKISKRKKSIWFHLDVLSLNYYSCDEIKSQRRVLFVYFTRSSKGAMLSINLSLVMIYFASIEWKNCTSFSLQQCVLEIDIGFPLVRLSNKQLIGSVFSAASIYVL